MVNVGIIGCGYWGAKHVRIFNTLPDARLTIVCDQDKEKLNQVREQYPYVARTSDYRDLFSDSVDALVIATPVSTHYNFAREALLHGKHVLAEKPLTASNKEAVELVKLAKKQNRVLMVGHTFIYHPAVDYLRQLIQSGELGEILYIDTARLNLGLIRPDVNVIWDLAPHDISIILYILDKEPISVRASGAAHFDPTVHDVAYLELKFDKEVLAHVHVSWLDPCKVRRVTIVGSRKMAVYNDISDSEKIRIYDKGINIPTDNDNFAGWPPRYRFGDVLIPFISNAEPLKMEGSEFVRCVIEGKNPKSDGWAGLRVVNILETAQRSLMNGGGHQKLRTLLPDSVPVSATPGGR